MAALEKGVRLLPVGERSRTAGSEKALLLHLAGFDVQDIFETLEEPDGDGDEYVKAATAIPSLSR